MQYYNSSRVKRNEKQAISKQEQSVKRSTLQRPHERRLRAIRRHLTRRATTTRINHSLVLREVPRGNLRADHFEKFSSPFNKDLPDGHVLLETLAITIGAGQRAGLQGGATYAGATQSDTSAPMSGTGVGRVLASRFPGIERGDIMAGGTGWQTLATLPGKILTHVPKGIEPSLMLGALGTNGLTAYFGLLEIGQPKKGETVVVSGAAGSVGHLVGQIAKIKGCRVVGVAGSDAKCCVLVDELGFDAAINYKSKTFRADMKEATPRRIDIYFDNTGGNILQTALFRMATFGRIVCCGNVSQYDTATPGGGPKGVPGMLVNNQVRMQGFVVYSFRDRWKEAREDMAVWFRKKLLKAWTTEYEGLEAAPNAFVDM